MPSLIESEKNIEKGCGTLWRRLSYGRRLSGGAATFSPEAGAFLGCVSSASGFAVVFTFSSFGFTLSSKLH